MLCFSLVYVYLKREMFSFLKKIRAFNIEIHLMLIVHRILWKGNTVKMAGGDIYHLNTRLVCSAPLFSLPKNLLIEKCKILFVRLGFKSSLNETQKLVSKKICLNIGKICPAMVAWFVKASVFHLGLTYAAFYWEQVEHRHWSCRKH